MDAFRASQASGSISNVQFRAPRNKSIALLFALISHGHTAGAGVFRSHVARLVEFLKNLENLNASEMTIVDRAVQAASTGHVPAGEWLKMARQKTLSWKDVARKS